MLPTLSWQRGGLREVPESRELLKTRNKAETGRDSFDVVHLYSTGEFCKSMEHPVDDVYHLSDLASPSAVMISRFHRNDPQPHVIKVP
jgi:hypothetical protein